MTTTLAIYLIGLADAVNVMSILLAAVGASILIIWALAISFTGDRRKEYKQLGKWSLLLALPLLTVVFVPTGKTIAAMLVIPRIVENEQVQNISQSALDLLEAKAKDWANDALNVKNKETTPEL